jgi:hypothetical protein
VSTYLLDRPVVFVAPCGGLVAATVNGEDLPEFIRDHRGWRLEVMESADVRAARWCTGTDGCRPQEVTADA